MNGLENKKPPPNKGGRSENVMRTAQKELAPAGSRRVERTSYAAYEVRRKVEDVISAMSKIPAHHQWLRRLEIPDPDMVHLGPNAPQSSTEGRYHLLYSGGVKVKGRVAYGSGHYGMWVSVLSISIKVEAEDDLLEGLRRSPGAAGMDVATWQQIWPCPASAATAEAVAVPGPFLNGLRAEYFRDLLAAGGCTIVAAAPKGGSYDSATWYRDQWTADAAWESLRACYAHAGCVQAPDERDETGVRRMVTQPWLDRVPSDPGTFTVAWMQPGA